MRKKIFAVLLAIGIFLVGAIFGVLVSKMSFMRMFPFPHPDAGHDFNSNKMPQRAIDMMTKELNLTDEQREKLINILEKNKESIDTLFKEIDQKVQERFDFISNEIRAILNEKQKQKFEKMAQKFKKSGPPPPPY